MIKYITNKDIDRNKWDECIKSSFNGLPYAYSWYLDIVSYKWNALVEDNYNSVMPLPFAEKYGFGYIYPPPFTQQLGVFSTSKLTDEKVQRFLEHIPEKFKYVEMNLNVFNSVKTTGLKTRQLVTHLLDLIPSYEQLQSKYSTQTKRNLKKAQAGQLTILKNVHPQDVINLFRKNRGKEYGHTSSYYKMLHTLMFSCLKKNFGQCWGVITKEKVLCAGAFFIGSNKHAIFLFSGANDKGYEAQAITYLINEFIESNSQRDITFDFEGSMNADIARFYRGFGSKEAHFTQVRRNTLPSPVKWLKEMQFKRKIS